VTQEDFELAVAKVMRKDADKDLALKLRKWAVCCFVRWLIAVGVLAFVKANFTS
jgi:hypothetical protein